MYVESAKRVLVVCGNEDNGHVAADELEHLEAIELRHLNVEKHEIGLELGDCLDRLEPVGALRDDVDVWNVRQVLAQHTARQCLIVHDDHPEPSVSHESD